MKFIGAMAVTLSGLFFFGLVFAVPEISRYDFSAWNVVFLIIAAFWLMIASVGITVLGLWWGNKK